MSNRTLTFLTLCVLLGIGVLLAINLMTILPQTSSKEYIERGQVRGSAVQHDGKPYTLNFQQQNALIDHLNHAIEIKKSATPELAATTPKLEIEKIIFYRFNANNIEITPISYDGNNLIFSAPDWNRNGLLQDTSAGQLKTLLSQTYDH